MSVLVVAEHDGKEISPATLAAVTAAQEIGGDVHLLVAGESCADAAASACSVAGVAKVLQLDSADFAQRLAEPWAQLIAQCAASYSHVLAGSSTFAKNCLPRAAAIMDVEPITEILQIDSPKRFVRAIYAGDIWQTVESAQEKQVLIIRPTAFAKAEIGAESAVCESFAAADINTKQSEWVGVESHGQDRPQLTSAKVVFSGGRGLQTKENFNRWVKIADHYGAAVGASRAAVDAEMAPNDWQVGQTGQIVAPEVYIAIGISGATQHLAGMKDSKTVFAINKDADAPIFSVADYGLVADMESVLTEWEAKL